MFVVNESELPGFPLEAAPSFLADGGVTSAAWRREGKIYLLAGTMPKEELQALL